MGTPVEFRGIAKNWWKTPGIHSDSYFSEGNLGQNTCSPARFAVYNQLNMSNIWWVTKLVELALAENSHFMFLFSLGCPKRLGLG